MLQIVKQMLLLLSSGTGADSDVGSKEQRARLSTR